MARDRHPFVEIAVAGQYVAVGVFVALAVFAALVACERDFKKQDLRMQEARVKW